MYIPTRVLFRAGRLNDLKEQKMPDEKAMIVISNGKSTKVNGYLTRTEEQLHLAGVEIEQHVCDERFVRMAQAMDIGDAKEPMDFITALTKLQEERIE